MVERMVGSTFNANNVHGVVNDNINPYRTMVIDAMTMNQGYASQCSIIDEESNADTSRFFDLLKDSDESLWDGSQIIVNYWSLNRCLPSSWIIG
jgi:hypothetical protein